MMDELTEHNSEPVEQDLKLTSDAVPLCLNCLEPCNPLDNYCPNCGSNEAINPLASYMPFVDLRFRVGMIGKLWHKAWAKDTEWIDRGIYISLLMLFCPIILVMGLLYLFYEKTKRQKPVFQQESD